MVETAESVVVENFSVASRNWLEYNRAIHTRQECPENVTGSGASCLTPWDEAVSWSPYTGVEQGTGFGSSPGSSQKSRMAEAGTSCWDRPQAN